MNPIAAIRRLLYAALGLLFVLRIDLWMWNDPGRVLGLPAGLTYHVGFCFAAAICLWLLVRYAWPRHLAAGGEVDEQPAEGAE